MAEINNLARCVRDSAEFANLLPADYAALELAVLYASRIDADGKRITDLGPKLLACLKELGMTQLGRAAPKAPKEVAPDDRDDAASVFERLRNSNS